MENELKKTENNLIEHAPILLDEDNVHYKGGTPYILIGILIFIIITAFWKVHMGEKSITENRKSEVSVKQNPEELLRERMKLK